MRDISARELKGHNILAVERFWDNTRWMIEFSVLRPSTAYGSPGDDLSYPQALPPATLPEYPSDGRSLPGSPESDSTQAAPPG